VTYWETPRRTAARFTAYAHPKLPGSAPAVQFGPSQKAVTGLKSTWGKGEKTARPRAWGTGSPLPVKARERTTDDLLRDSNGKTACSTARCRPALPKKPGSLDDDLFGATKKKWRPVTPKKRS
jgi:hypothetical protein